MTTSSQKPVTLRDGSIKATIWANQTEQGKAFYNVTLVRTYRDGETFKETPSFGATELLKVSRLAGKAYDRIAELKAESKDADNGTQH